nr:unnamed protein product [Callosobruchus analis]
MFNQNRTKSLGHSSKTIEIRIAGIEQKLQEMNLKNNTIIKDLKDETAILRTENEHLMRQIDELDQKARLKNIRIFKLKETDDEILTNRVTELFQSKMGIRTRNEDILSCTRTGKKAENKTKGILLELANISLKNKIYDKKKLLKGSGVVLKEDLTGNRLKLMELAIEKHSLWHVWSYRRNVYVYKNNKRHLISCESDINKL